MLETGGKKENKSPLEIPTLNIGKRREREKGGVWLRGGLTSSRHNRVLWKKAWIGGEKDQDIVADRSREKEDFEGDYPYIRQWNKKEEKKPNGQ